MIATFRAAGYHVAGGFEDGVMSLEFPIDPTDTAIGVMENREHRAEATSIAKFFDARSVAVIGASRRQDTIGQVLVRNLVTGDFTGVVHAVNPSADAVSGLSTLTVNGNTTVNAGTVATTGNQDYNGDLTLAGGGAKNLSAGQVAVDGNLVGGNSVLTVTGSAVLGDAQADTVAGLAGLVVTGGTTLVPSTA